jgi:hypothetical protein
MESTPLRIMWTIWRERNSRTFNAIELPTLQHLFFFRGKDYSRGFFLFLIWMEKRIGDPVRMLRFLFFGIIV